MAIDGTVGIDGTNHLDGTIMAGGIMIPGADPEHGAVHGPGITDGIAGTVGVVAMSLLITITTATAGQIHGIMIQTISLLDYMTDPMPKTEAFTMDQDPPVCQEQLLKVAQADYNPGMIIIMTDIRNQEETLMPMTVGREEHDLMMKAEQLPTE